MITSKHVVNGLVALWEATDDGHSKVMLPATDAAHALDVDPDRWSLVDLDNPKDPPAHYVPEQPATDDDSAKGSG
jgi:hypothetical protein